MANRYVFSTGSLFVGAVGATLTDDDRIAAVQDVNFELGFQKSEVFEVPRESLFPVATGFHSGQGRLRCTVESVDPDSYGVLLDATVSTAGTASTVTIAKTTKPTFCKVQLIGEDSEGNNITITMEKAICMGIPLNFALTRHATSALDFEAYPDDDDNVITIEFA